MKEQSRFSDTSSPPCTNCKFFKKQITYQEAFPYQTFLEGLDKMVFDNFCNKIKKGVANPLAYTFCHVFIRKKDVKEKRNESKLKSAIERVTKLFTDRNETVVSTLDGQTSLFVLVQDNYVPDNEGWREVTIWQFPWENDDNITIQDLDDYILLHPFIILMKTDVDDFVKLFSSLLAKTEEEK